MKELSTIYVKINTKEEYLKALLILSLYSKKEHDTLAPSNAKLNNYVGFLFINKNSSLGYYESQQALNHFHKYFEISYENLLANY